MLETATALELCGGGAEPWNTRNYDIGEPDTGDDIPLLAPLQKQLGYKFRNSKLLTEALCHPTFRSQEVSSYQRLEFLGDGM